jgi:3-oxoacyl-[acyl-carrier-protein] synthase III
MPAIIDQGIAMLGDMYDVFMQKLGWSPNDITKFLHHQVGVRAFKRHAEYAKIPTRIMPNTVSTMGNLIAANIPVGLYKLMQNKEISEGEKVFISGAGSGLSVSQAGLIWNAA